MDIRKYTGYFHDGGLIGVVREENNLELFLRSCEIGSGDSINRKYLSKDNALKGKLCLAGVKHVKVDDREKREIPRREYDDGEVLDLELSDTTVFLLIEWTNFPPKPHATGVNAIEIEAEKITWENMPDLSDNHFKRS